MYIIGSNIGAVKMTSWRPPKMHILILVCMKLGRFVYHMWLKKNK